VVSEAKSLRCRLHCSLSQERGRGALMKSATTSRGFDRLRICLPVSSRGLGQGLAGEACGALRSGPAAARAGIGKNSGSQALHRRRCLVRERARAGFCRDMYPARLTSCARRAGCAKWSSRPLPEAGRPCAARSGGDDQGLRFDGHPPHVPRELAVPVLVSRTPGRDQCRYDMAGRSA